MLGEMVNNNQNTVNPIERDNLVMKSIEKSSQIVEGMERGSKIPARLLA